jgi:hypothetical protein
VAKQRTLDSGNYAFCIVYSLTLIPWHSNCQGSLILDVLRYARIKPQVLQVELHPYLTQEALVALAKELGIAITAYSSFGPQSYIELSMDRAAPSLLAHDVVTNLANQYKKSRFISLYLSRNNADGLRKLRRRFYCVGPRNAASPVSFCSALWYLFFDLVNEQSSPSQITPNDWFRTWTARPLT